MKKYISFLALTCLLISCSSVRMKYDGEFKTGDGRSGKYVYERSYEVKTLRLWCIITGIVYGGACWGYLILPTSNMKEAFHKDAEAKLLELSKAQNVSFDPANARFLSWDDAVDIQQVTLYGNTIATPGQIPTAQPAQVPAPPAQTSNTGEFIR